MDSEQSRQLAQNENTAPDKLRELADSSDSITRQYVVANPNVPPDVLIKLAEQFPRQVFNNPAIDLLLLETPALFSGTLENVLSVLLKREVPMRMIEYAANSGNERLKLAILMNPQTPPEILDRLAQSENQEISEAAKTHVNYSQAINNYYSQFVCQKIDAVVGSSANYIDFKNSLNTWKCANIFAGDNIEDYDFEQIIKYYDYLSKIEYESLAVSFENINKLSSLQSKDDIYENRKYILQIADNSNIPLVILEKIVDLDKYGSTHKTLIKNPNISIYIIKKNLDRCFSLIDQSVKNVYNVRPIIYEAILNPIMPMEIIKEIATHPNDSIKLILVNTPTVPQYLVKEIVSDFEKNGGGEDVVKSVNFSRNLLISSKLIDKLVFELKEYLMKDNNDTYSKRRSKLKALQTLSRHPNINPNTLKTLLKYQNGKIARDLLLNPKIPQYILEEWGISFIGDIYENDLDILAKNTFVSDDILKKLIRRRNHNYSCTFEALNNPCISNTTFSEWQDSDRYDAEILKEVATIEQETLDTWRSTLSNCDRLVILQSSQTPTFILAKVSLSTSWLERYAIVQNPNTPLPIIKRLAEDGNRIVRTAAKLKLKTKQ